MAKIPQLEELETIQRRLKALYPKVMHAEKLIEKDVRRANREIYQLKNEIAVIQGKVQALKSELKII